MLDRVRKTILRYSMFAPGDRVAAAVSGGADSVCLLHLLAGLDLRLSVVHVNHKLRGDESEEDARFVLQLAERLGLEARIVECDVSQAGGNLEQEARRARYDLFRELPVDRVATGHTKSDQAETVLFRFLRGSGSAGLAGIRPVTTDRVVRPLIEVERSEIVDYLREHGITWREDSTNAALDFARNRIRHELLPSLARDWNPALADMLARTAEWAYDEEAYWATQIDTLAADLIRPDSDEAVLLPAGDVTRLPRAAARRLLRRAIERVKGDLRGITFEHVDRILDLASAPEGHDRTQAPGIDVFRSFDWMRMSRMTVDNLENRNFQFNLPVPASVALPGSQLVVSVEVLESARHGDCVYNNEVSHVDWDCVTGPLTLRNWRPGDQYQPVGRAGEHKVKSLFHEARVPLWERRHWPIIVCNDTIIWTRRFGPASVCAATPESRSVLEIREHQAVGRF